MKTTEMKTDEQKAEEAEYYRRLAEYEADKKKFDETIGCDPNKSFFCKSSLCPHPPDLPEHMRPPPETADMDAELEESLKDITQDQPPDVLFPNVLIKEEVVHHPPSKAHLMEIMERTEYPYISGRRRPVRVITLDSPNYDPDILWFLKGDGTKLQVALSHFNNQQETDKRVDQEIRSFIGALGGRPDQDGVFGHVIFLINNGFWSFGVFVEREDIPASALSWR